MEQKEQAQQSSPFSNSTIGAETPSSDAGTNAASPDYVHECRIRPGATAVLGTDAANRRSLVGGDGNDTLLGHRCDRLSYRQPSVEDAEAISEDEDGINQDEEEISEDEEEDSEYEDAFTDNEEEITAAQGEHIEESRKRWDKQQRSLYANIMKRQADVLELQLRGRPQEEQKSSPEPSDMYEQGEEEQCLQGRLEALQHQVIDFQAKHGKDQPSQDQDPSLVDNGELLEKVHKLQEDIQQLQEESGPQESREETLREQEERLARHEEKLRAYEELLDRRDRHLDDELEMVKRQQEVLKEEGKSIVEKCRATMLHTIQNEIARLEKETDEHKAALEALKISVNNFNTLAPKVLSTKCPDDRCVAIQIAKVDRPGPEGLRYPQRIIPWIRFHLHQEDLYKRLTGHPEATPNLFKPLPDKHWRDHDATRFSRDFANRLEAEAEHHMKEVWGNQEVNDDSQIYALASFERVEFIGEKKYHMSNIDIGRGDITVALAVYRSHYDLDAMTVFSVLRGYLRPERDVINNGNIGFVSGAKRKVTAAITHLYSHMLDRHVRFGYITTGELYIFLVISEKNPSDVECHLWVPSVTDKPQHEYHRDSTQVALFIMNAVRAEPVGSGWVEEAENVARWPERSQQPRYARPYNMGKPSPPYQPSIANAFRGVDFELLANAMGDSRVCSTTFHTHITKPDGSSDDANDACDTFDNTPQNLDSRTVNDGKRPADEDLPSQMGVSGELGEQAPKRIRSVESGCSKTDDLLL